MALPGKKIAADDSEVRVGYARIRRAEVDVVEYVEEVGDKLDLLVFVGAESEDLVHTKIPVLVPGAVDLANSAVTEAEALRLRKTAGVKPFADHARVGLSVANVICALAAVLG